ncbi:MAG TPA: DNA metabolism protein [Morganella sp. (in: Bacteria)]|nr:DNA metabolism protein [Morganella sp. (in: enterobacteria)]
MPTGSAQNPHVLRVRSGSSALSVTKLPAPITPTGIGSYSFKLHPE